MKREEEGERRVDYIPMGPLAPRYFLPLANEGLGLTLSGQTGSVTVITSLFTRSPRR